ncbi:FAR1-related sequence 5-like protein [Tanacetum coccineum]
MEGHPYARRLSKDEYRLVEDMTKKNVPPRDILSILKAQNENNVSTIKDIYNAQYKIRKALQVGKSPMQVVMSFLHSNGYVHDFSTNDVTNELKALFFVHPTSFKIWRAFPHIVGVTSTGKTFCIAFAFISEEKMDNYKWVLECLKLTLDECMLPRVIITDRDLALMNACEKVFPNATRLLCRWHISQNILKNCRQTIKVERDWDSFLSAWKLLEDSPTWISYMENYKQLQLVLRKYPRVLSYVDDNWLNNHKEKFVSAWCDQSFNFGNRTTNRVESQHAKLKKTLDVSWSTPLEHEDIQCDDELHIFKDTFNKQSNAGKKSLLRRLGDILNPSTNLIREPAVKKNTRGRPSLKKQKTKKFVYPKSQDPGIRSYSTRLFGIDLNMESARHSSYSNYETCAPNLFPDLNEEPARHSSVLQDEVVTGIADSSASLSLGRCLARNVRFLLDPI